jgi:hypothetical protein
VANILEKLEKARRDAELKALAEKNAVDAKIASEAMAKAQEEATWAREEAQKELDKAKYEASRTQIETLSQLPKMQLSLSDIYSILATIRQDQQNQYQAEKSLFGALLAVMFLIAIDVGFILYAVISFVIATAVYIF